jgi:hypothetical protein
MSSKYDDDAKGGSESEAEDEVKGVSGEPSGRARLFAYVQVAVIVLYCGGAPQELHVIDARKPKYIGTFDLVSNPFTKPDRHHSIHEHGDLSGMSTG